MLGRHLLLLFAVAAVVTASGCRGGGGKQAAEGTVEFAAFQGGYGLDFFEQESAEFSSRNPDLTVDIWGNPRVWEQLRPRFIAGNPPDLVWPGYGLDHWALVYDGQITALDDALGEPAFDGRGDWRSTFNPEILKLGQYEGRQYMLPLHFNIQGWWYNPDVFEANGWSVPETIDELFELCAKIRASGIAPITFQGQYPYYMLSGFIIPWAMSDGGPEVIRAIGSLEPGAWEHPSIIKAAEYVERLRSSGYFQSGATGMSHTDAQMEFLTGRAAMVPCGTWLYNEMREVMPPNAKMAYMLPPVVAGGRGDPSAIMIGVEPWMIPTNAKNPRGGIELLRYLTSAEVAARFVEQKGTLVAVNLETDATYPPHLRPAADAFSRSGYVYSLEFTSWYKTMWQGAQDAMSALLMGDMSPREFARLCEAAAERARQDPDTVIRQLP